MNKKFFRGFLVIPLFMSFLITTSLAEELECPLISDAEEFTEYYANIVNKDLFSLVSDSVAQSDQKKIKQAIDACLLPASKAKTVLNDKYFLVDVRAQKEFEKNHLSGSINVHLSEIDKKPFLKKNPIVLFSNAYLDFELVRKCKELKDAGINEVYVLEGGVENFVAVGSKIPIVNRIKAISPKSFVALKDKLNWLVVAVTNFEHHVKDKRNIIYVPGNSSDEIIAKEISNLIQTNVKKFGFHLKVLLVFDDERDIKGVEGLLNEGVAPYVYLMEGGVRGYSRFLIAIDRLLKHKNDMKNKKLASCRNAWK